jgi:prolyl-tRNA editing enzyme YbaK/EbsC (Cys-tRNA(Pro) deacylase)
VVADAGIRSVDRVAIGAGTHGVNLHVASEDLIRTLGASVVDVTKPDDG